MSPLHSERRRRPTGALQSMDGHEHGPSDPEAPNSGDSNGPLFEPAAGLYRVAWIAYLVLAIIALVWIGIREHGIGTALLWSEGLVGPAIARSLAIDVGLGLASAAVLVLLWEVAERTAPGAAEVGQQLRSMLSALTPSEAVSLAVLSGVSEELFFRGAVQSSWGGVGGLIGATALFAVLHGGPGKQFRWWTLFAAVSGGLMGSWVLVRGTLTAALVTHVAVNGFQLLRAARRNARRAAGLNR